MTRILSAVLALVLLIGVAAQAQVPRESRIQGKVLEFVPNSSITLEIPLPNGTAIKYKFNVGKFTKIQGKVEKDANVLLLNGEEARNARSITVLNKK